MNQHGIINLCVNIIILHHESTEFEDIRNEKKASKVVNRGAEVYFMNFKLDENLYLPACI